MLTGTISCEGFSVLSYEDYNAIKKKKQGKRCAICGELEKSKNLAVDHNHRTHRVRGLLCSKCNRMLGFVQDNTLILQKAIAYLNEHGE